jgi:multiple sugar transport system permease protein
MLALLWSVGPVAWQVLTAFKPDAQITHYPVIYWPHPPTSEHFAAIWERKPFGIYLLNSTFISAFATILCLVFAAPAAMALSRMRARHRDAVLLGFPSSLFSLPSSCSFLCTKPCARWAGSISRSP